MSSRGRVDIDTARVTVPTPKRRELRSARALAFPNLWCAGCNTHQRATMSRALVYAAAGVVLSLGEPIGLLFVREIYGARSIPVELLLERVTYIYVSVTTAILIGSLGYLLGRQADRLEALSETDALTGLANRRAFRRRLTDDLRRARRYGSPVSLLLVDVDGLKRINDERGHSAGDRVIRRVADAITATLREADLGARWGGDEFAVLMPDTPGDAARHSAERLAAHLRWRSGD